jgi:hypothetical protein
MPGAGTVVDAARGQAVQTTDQGVEDREFELLWKEKTEHLGSIQRSLSLPRRQSSGGIAGQSGAVRALPLRPRHTGDREPMKHVSRRIRTERAAAVGAGCLRHQQTDQPASTGLSGVMGYVRWRPAALRYLCGQSPAAVFRPRHQDPPPAYGLLPYQRSRPATTVWGDLLQERVRTSLEDGRRGAFRKPSWRPCRPARPNNTSALQRPPALAGGGGRGATLQRASLCCRARASVVMRAAPQPEVAGLFLVPGGAIMRSDQGN